MKQLIVVLLFGFLGHGLLAQMKIKEKDSLAIASIMEKQEKAWNEGDISGFMEGYLKSPKIVFSGAGGPQYGWQAIKERYEKAYPNQTQMGQLTFTILSLQQWSPTFVLLEGKYELARSIGDAFGYFSVGWLKKGGQWYMVNDHTSASNTKP